MGQVIAKRTQNYSSHGEHVFNNCSLHYCNRSRTNHYSEHSDYLSAQTALRCSRCPEDPQTAHSKTGRSHILSRHPLHHLFFTALRILLGYLPDPQFTVTMVTELLFLIAGLTLLYIVGIADDLMGVRYRKKFLCADHLCRILSASRTLYQQFLRTFRDLRDSHLCRNSPDHAAGGIHYQCYQPD